MDHKDEPKLAFLSILLIIKKNSKEQGQQKPEVSNGYS